MEDVDRGGAWVILVVAWLAIWCGDSEETGTGGGAGGSQGGAGGAGGADAGQCPGSACQAGQICIAYRTVGGAVFEPDDAGACPSGRHVEPFGNGRGMCVADWGYQCVELRGCAGKVSCSCGQASCPSGYSACGDPPANDMWIDPAAQLTCSLLAP